MTQKKSKTILEKSKKMPEKPILEKPILAKNLAGKVTRRSALVLGGVGGTLAACGVKQPTSRGTDTQNGLFRHGIASGDPLQTRLILWTAISPDGAPPKIFGDIATDDSFTNIVWTGEFAVRTALKVNGTIALKHDADGLQPGQEYFYRFRSSSGETSPIGRTKTLAAGHVDALNIAIVSCSNHPAGYFHAYRHIADSAPVDTVIHLGDYIYEYGLGGFGTGDAETLERVPDPPHECITLDDYRRRYAQYRSDPDLQAAHAAAPWIMTWDDHESANDSWTDGADNHQPDEGDWAVREAASLRAFYEWTPTREPENGAPRSAFWRDFTFGNLASLTMIETRLSGRSAQIDWALFPVPADADPKNPEVQAKVASFENDLIGDPSRRMLGNEQSAFVEDSFTRAVANGLPWQLLGNQILLAKIRSPNYVAALPAWLKWMAKRKNPQIFQYFLRSRFQPPLNIDAWDGYPAARERLYAGARRADANLISLAGDTHDFNASILRDEDGVVVGAELGTSGVSSPGNFIDVVAPGVDFGRLTEKANPDTILHDAYNYGYTRLNLRRAEAIAEFISTSTVKQPTFTAKTAHRFRLTPGKAGEAVKIERL